MRNLRNTCRNCFRFRIDCFSTEKYRKIDFKCQWMNINILNCDHSNDRTMMPAVHTVQHKLSYKLLCWISVSNMNVNSSVLWKTLPKNQPINMSTFLCFRVEGENVRPFIFFFFVIFQRWQNRKQTYSRALKLMHIAQFIADLSLSGSCVFFVFHIVSSSRVESKF